jgi:hypothetical protein
MTGGAWPLRTLTSVDVICARCGALRDSSLAHVSDKPPCPECGATGVTFRLGIASEVNVAGSVSLALGTLPSRDWKRRWDVLQQELARLRTPHVGELSGDAVHAAQHELQSFYIQAYHLKDALIADSPSHGIKPDAIENAITADPNLALIADLANFDKHGALDRPPRSGHVPSVASARGLRAGSGEGGWQLEVVISHDAQRLDGLDVAERAIDSWRRHLRCWGLI